MLEVGVGLGLIVLFGASAALGFAVKARLPEHHRSLETMELIQLVMSLLITFAAVVLGLLTTSVKTSYDTAEHDRAEYAETLTQLDRCLRNYGAATDPIRLQLRRYVGGVIASTWSDEPRPVGIDLPDVSHAARTGADPILAGLMNGVGLAIRDLAERDPAHQARAEDCMAVYRDVLKSRGAILEDLDQGMSVPFYCMVVFWLAIAFAGFGLRAPRNATVAIVIGLGIVAVASALDLILDLDMPYEGVFRITSEAMRTALLRMSVH